MYVYTCHGLKLQVPQQLFAVVCFRVINVRLHVGERPESTKLRRWSSTFRYINLACSMWAHYFNLSPCAWDRGGPIQTLSLWSKTLCTLKHSLFTVGLCLDLCHIALWPSERRLLRLVSKTGNSELLWVPAQQGLVLMGFIRFSTYWHIWFCGLCKSFGCFLVITSHIIYADNV